MMQRLDRTVLVAYIFNPRLSVPEFYQHVATLLEVQKWETKSELLMELGRCIESRHARGLRTVLIIDEAQGLSPHVLEEIRLLSNFESDTCQALADCSNRTAGIARGLEQSRSAPTQTTNCAALRHQAFTERRGN